MGVVVLSGLFFLFSPLFLITFFLILNNNKFFSFSSNFLGNGSSFFFPASFSFDYVSFWFLLMIFLVTTMVVLYSELYMEHYNNIKFLFLLLSFFTSMFILSLSDSFSVLATGWDFLGITSLCLIMFYPNKSASYNSFLTSFFNRLGDTILVICSGIFLSFPALKCFSSSLSALLFLLMMFCGLTKSAQFPLSSWLPAAMSAPTPISAMVHSSTLVTAGVYMYMKTYGFLGNFNSFIFLSFFSFLTFSLGGMLANFESDFKKIVAFSTMSQISMIILLISGMFIFIAVSHMIFHALFKTLLFCIVGVYLMWMLGNQNSNALNSSSNSLFLNSLMLISIFSMTGLMFSSSFFSKDLILESSMNSSSLCMFLFLFLGGSFTLLYSSKIFSFLSSFSKNIPINMEKNSLIKFFLIFGSLTLILGPILNYMGSCFYSPFISFFENLFLILFFLYLLTPKLLANSLYLNASLNIFSLKDSTFSSSMVLYLATSLKGYSMDHMFFKPSLLYSHSYPRFSYASWWGLSALILSSSFLIFF